MKKLLINLFLIFFVISVLSIFFLNYLPPEQNNLYFVMDGNVSLIGDDGYIMPINARRLQNENEVLALTKPRLTKGQYVFFLQDSTIIETVNNGSTLTYNLYVNSGKRDYAPLRNKIYNPQHRDYYQIFEFKNELKKIKLN